MADAIFDFIIIGAGSAGCVLANRLSADPGARVLLLEAGGPDRSAMIHMPAGVPALLGKPNRHNWYYHTEPQAHLDARRLYWPRGKGWGGSSSINGMIYIRGQPRDYDMWRQQGCTGWGWSDVLPYFKRAETYEGGADAWHGEDGPLKVSNGRSRNPLFAAFIAAGEAAGYPRTADFNGASQEGFGRYQLNIHNGRRWSAARAYLAPALGCANLTVESHALAARILFEGTRAEGVEYLQNGKTVRARAGEVVLCGGAVNTPQVLMLSGIGDAATLNRLDIAVTADLPGVGRNLQDHLDASIQYESRRPITLYSQRGLTALASGVRYLLTRTGPAASQGLESGGFVKSRPELETPDLQFHFIIGLMTDHTRTAPDRHGFMAHVCHLRPESRGFVTLQSADPRQAPLIQPNYLDSAEDRRALRQGVRIARRLFAQAPFDAYRGDEMMPGAQVQSDAELDAALRRTAETIYHPVGSARMGPDGDAVVDINLKVHGVTGLRVVDASVMPTLISGNTNAATVMIAEKAADLILERA